MRCPKDGSACCDDMCHGAGCLQMDGYAMLAECDVCGGLIDEEIPDCSTCTCGDDDGDGWYEYDDWPDDDGRDDALNTRHYPSVEDQQHNDSLRDEPR